MKSKTIQFILKNDLAELRKLFRRCEQMGRSFGLSDKIIFQTNLVLDELFTNIVSYGFSDQKEHTITVTITLDGGVLGLLIEDDGLAFDPIQAPDPDLACDLENAKVGGLGIHLIKQLMDEISYQRVGGKNVLKLKRYLSTPEA